MNGQLRHVKTFDVAPARPRVNSFQLRTPSPGPSFAALVPNFERERKEYDYISLVCTGYTDYKDFSTIYKMATLKREK